MFNKHNLGGTANKLRPIVGWGFFIFKKFLWFQGGESYDMK